VTDIPIEITISQEIEAEIERLTDLQERTDTIVFDLQAQYNEAAATADASEKPEDLATATALHRRLISALASGTDTSMKIQTLRHPSELERRVNSVLANKESIRRLRMSEQETASKKPTPRDQGFPDVYLSESGKFRIGMDARAKSDLVASVVGDITPEDLGNALHCFTEDEAVKLLEARGWTGFLERKQQILAEKTAAKEARAKEREEAARVRAAEKEKKDAEKKAAAEAKAKAEAEAKAAAAESGDAADTATSKQPSRSSRSSSGKSEQQRAAREAKAAAAAAK